MKLQYLLTFVIHRKYKKINNVLLAALGKAITVVRSRS